MRMVLVYLSTLACLLSSTQSARILGIFPMAFKSHFSYSREILNSLHAAGHHITMISPFSVESKIENFTYIDSRHNTSMYVGEASIEDFKSMSVNSVMEFTNAMDIEHCYNVMRLPEIQEAFTSQIKLYDIMLVELVMAFECYLPLARKLDIPVIGTVSISFSKLADDAMGIPSNPAILSTICTNCKFTGNFFERIQNLWTYLVLNYNYAMKTLTALEEFNQKFFFQRQPPKKQISLLFYNNHPSLLPRALTPNVVEVGGIHIKPANPLPQDLENFIDRAPQGVIIFTLGTVVNASSLPLKLRRAILDGFASIPQRVIWKYDAMIEDLPKNILIRNWLPQRDILEHKKVVAFVSHCGINGVYEAVFTGTPVVCIPILGDQTLNAAVLRHRRVSVDLDINTLTKETLVEALNTIVNDTSYYQRMQALSRAFKARPLTPQESVVYWTEYIIQHSEEPYLKPIGMDISLYKYLMLDMIIIFFVIITSLTVYVIRAMIQASKFKNVEKKDN